LVDEIRFIYVIFIGAQRSTVLPLFGSVSQGKTNV